MLLLVSRDFGKKDAYSRAILTVAIVTIILVVVVAFVLVQGIPISSVPSTTRQEGTTREVVLPPSLLRVASVDELVHIHASMINPEDPSVLFVGAHTGLVAGFNTSDFDYEWWYINQEDFDFTGFWLDPEQASVMYSFAHPTAAEETGIRRSLDLGQNWELVTSRPDPHKSVVSQTEPYVFYALDFPTFALVRGEDKGSSWKVLNNPSDSTIHALAVNPQASLEVLVGAEDGLFKSKDGGFNWEPITSLSGFFVTSVAYHPNKVDVIYAGTLSSDFVLKRSTDGGSTWSDISEGIAPREVVRFISFDQRNPDVIVIATIGAIYKTIDDGSNWVLIRPPDEVTQVLPQAE